MTWIIGAELKRVLSFCSSILPKRGCEKNLRFEITIVELFDDKRQVIKFETGIDSKLLRGIAAFIKRCFLSNHMLFASIVIVALILRYITKNYSQLFRDDECQQTAERNSASSLIRGSTYFLAWFTSALERRRAFLYYLQLRPRLIWDHV